jgi:hypothetical protein
VTPSNTTTSPTATASRSTTTPTGGATTGSASSPAQSTRTISLFAQPDPVVYPGQVTLSGTISSADTSCEDNEFVRIQRRVLGTTTYENFETDNTDADGRFEVSFPSTQSAEYVATAPAHDQCADATSSPASSTVKVKITRRSSRRSLERGTSVRISGRVQPDHDGTSVVLQRKKGRRWVAVDRTDLDGRSRYRFVVDAGWRGRRTFRTLWKAQDDEHAANRSRGIVIRTTRP